MFLASVEKRSSLEREASNFISSPYSSSARSRHSRAASNAPRARWHCASRYQTSAIWSLSSTRRSRSLVAWGKSSSSIRIRQVAARNSYGGMRDSRSSSSMASSSVPAELSASAGPASSLAAAAAAPSCCIVAESSPPSAVSLVSMSTSSASASASPTSPSSLSSRSRCSMRSSMMPAARMMKGLASSGRCWLMRRLAMPCSACGLSWLASSASLR
mmetsp:Transcript_21035/g.53298  ORF Transcript_21035/g.53298 Transcript_21035/m.53298 type:complete len:216 (-) Transcript_21035:475-1122(-)